MRWEDTPQGKHENLRSEAVERKNQKREEMLKRKQGKREIFEEVLCKMNVGEIHELQGRISKMIYERYLKICNEYNDILDNK